MKNIFQKTIGVLPYKMEEKDLKDFKEIFRQTFIRSEFVNLESLYYKAIKELKNKDIKKFVLVDIGTFASHVIVFEDNEVPKRIEKLEIGGRSIDTKYRDIRCINLHNTYKTKYLKSSLSFEDHMRANGFFKFEDILQEKKKELLFKIFSRTYKFG